MWVVFFTDGEIKLRRNGRAYGQRIQNINQTRMINIYNKKDTFLKYQYLYSNTFFSKY